MLQVSHLHLVPSASANLMHSFAVRLWSLQTWTNLCVYKGHCFPVWDVKFSPHGYYFASAAYDRTARLWATDSHQPLRLFSGHISDVDVSHSLLQCDALLQPAY